MILSLILTLAASQGNLARSDIIGSKEVIQELRAAHDAAAESDPMKELGAKSARLKSRLGSISPDEAADKWVALADEWLGYYSKGQGYEFRDSWAKIMMSPLPGPPAWPMILAKLKESKDRNVRPVIGLVNDLLGNKTEAIAYLDSVRTEDPNRGEDHSAQASAEFWIAVRQGDLKLAAEIYSTSRLGIQLSGGNDVDLVQIFGSEEAKRLIPLGRPEDWLAEGLQDFEVAEAFVKKVGEENIMRYWDVETLYAFGLAERGQEDHALKLLGAYQSASVPEWMTEDRAQARTCLDLLSRLLKRKVLGSLIDLYVGLCRYLGEFGELSARLQSLLTLTNLDPQSRIHCMTAKAALDLTLGKTTQAISEYKATANAVLASGQYPTRTATTLLNLSYALQDPSLVLYVQELARKMGTEGSQLPLYGSFVGVGDLKLAQEQCISAMHDTHNVNLAASSQGRLLDAYPGTGAELAELYYKEKEPDQIIDLLKSYPRWGTDDLSAVIDTRQNEGQGGWYSASGLPMGFYAAWALSKTGQLEFAIRALHALLSQDDSVDSAYALLNQLEGARALSFYERMQQAHPYEARPLIWKGALLFQIRRLREAREAISQAFVLEPSVGDFNNDLFREAYQVLDAIYIAQKRTSEAKQCAADLRGLSVREQAWKEYTLITSDSAREFQEAFELNPKDYHARLSYAYCLEGLGREEEALKAYSSCLELIPFSEGRAAGVDPTFSYVFHDRPARELAHQVLARLVKKYPGSAAVLYCLGRLDEWEHSYSAAIALYKQAVEADPKFLQAWARIANLLVATPKTQELLETAVLTCIRSGEVGRIAHWNNYNDPYCGFPVLYEAYKQAAASSMPEIEGPLYPLPASKQGLVNGLRANAPYQSVTVRDGPGAMLGSITELAAFYP